MQQQTLVIGLDGASFDIIDPLIKEGRLPNIARLKAAGSWGKLRSVMHPESPQAWSSLLTGTYPGKHGILSFTRRAPDRYDWQVNTADDRARPDIAEVLAQQEMSAGLLNIPLTYPPHPTNGFCISGMGTPGLDSDFTFPKDLKKELLKSFGEDTWIEEGILNKTPLEYLRALHRSIDRTLQIGEFLLQRFPELDMYVMVFMASDRVQHFFWNYVDPYYPNYVKDTHPELRDSINGIYEHLDQAIGQLISGREDWNIVVMSDHGGGPFYRMVNLNRWLESEGYLRFLSVNPATKAQTSGYIKSAYRVFRHHVRPMLSRRQREAVRKLIPKAAMNQLRSYRRNPTLSQIDWSQTRAYAEGAYGRIFLNLTGREPQGVVPPEDREKILGEISEKLLALEDPLIGDIVIDRVYRGEDLFQGPFADQAPDLLIEWREWQYHTKDSFTAEQSVFSDPPYWQSSRLRHTGSHRLHGILLMKGERINEACEIDEARIIDIMPTLLYLLDASIPREVDGRILMEALRPEIQERFAPRYYLPSNHYKPHTMGEASYSQTDEEVVKQRLRELGYID